MIWIEGLGWISLLGIVLVAALFWYEHRLIKPSDLSKVNAAFFTINGMRFGDYNTGLENYMDNDIMGLLSQLF